MDKHKQITVLLKNHAELCFALSNTCVKNICMQNIRRLFFHCRVSRILLLARLGGNF